MAKVTLVIEAANESYAVDIPVSEHMMAELSQSLELSDEPLSLLLSGAFRSNDVMKVRKKTLEMRKWMVDEVLNGIRKALENHFGRNDTINGHKKVKP